jgi:hypothetical protein
MSKTKNNKAKTNLIKKEIMNVVAKIIPGAKIVDRKWIKTSNKNIRIFASKDYENRDVDTRSWYGFFKEDLVQEPNKIMIFTTGDIKRVLIISSNDFHKEILPYLRKAQDGCFFAVSWKDNNCFIARKDIPSSLREEVDTEGIDMTKHINNFSILGTTYEKYLSHFNLKEQTVNNGIADLGTMIKTIAEKDPTFLTKSTEEKLIIIRYNQIKQN